MLVTFFQPLPITWHTKIYSSFFHEANTLGIPTPFFLVDTSNSIRRGLSGASTAGRPRRPASGPDGVGGVIAKPNVMCRGEVGLEDREDESVENGKCFLGIIHFSTFSNRKNPGWPAER